MKLAQISVVLTPTNYQEKGQIKLIKTNATLSEYEWKQQSIWRACKLKTIIVLSASGNFINDDGNHQN